MTKPLNKKTIHGKSASSIYHLYLQQLSKPALHRREVPSCRQIDAIAAKQWRIHFHRDASEPILLWYLLGIDGHTSTLATCV